MSSVSPENLTKTPNPVLECAFKLHKIAFHTIEGVKILSVLKLIGKQM